MIHDRLEFDVVVVGGGVAGLTTAFYLLEAGQKVLLVDQNEIGQEASWAGGGILSPLKPWLHSQWHTDLTAHSLNCLEIIVAKMAAVGVTFEQNKTGLLYVNEPVDEKLQAWLSSQKNAELLSGDALHAVCEKSVVSKEWVSSLEVGIWMPKVANLRNPQFLQALRRYLLQHPDFLLQENAKASLVLACQNRAEAGDKLLGIDLVLKDRDKIFLPAQNIVITAGAWSTRLLSDIDIPMIKPVRGQMLLFKPKSALKTMIMHGDHYMIPRGDGLVLVGSTVEDVGFDKATTQSALEQLHEFAAGIMPEIRDLEPIKHWAGLRPAVESSQGIPLLGPVSQVSGLWINSGHYRNGIVHASGAAQLVVDAMQERSPQLSLTLDKVHGFMTPQARVSSADSEVT